MIEKKENRHDKIAAYIHIPFCEHICYYCDFNKVFLEGQPVDEYIECLLKEIELTVSREKKQYMETIYIGGGTPTSLTASQLDKLLYGVRNQIICEEKNEFTVEANPGDLTEEKLSVLKNYGVNRISMGVQTFDNVLLKKIGRKHTAEDVYQTIQLLEKNDFPNISIDLIYALPGQTLESFRDTLARALAMDLPHYSLYSLILENKTMFMNWMRRGRLQLPGEDIEAQMFEETMIAMEKGNKHQYEISNFSEPGKESQHNLMYWNNDHYYGFGAGASGYLGTKRYKNYGPIQHYMTPIRDGKLPIFEEEALTIENQMEEELFLGLRKKDGISFLRFEEKFQRSFDSVYGEVTEKLVQQGLVSKKQHRLVLSERGTLLGNEVFEQFLL